MRLVRVKLAPLTKRTSGFSNEVFSKYSSETEGYPSYILTQYLERDNDHNHDKKQILLTNINSRELPKTCTSSSSSVSSVSRFTSIRQLEAASDRRFLPGTFRISSPTRGSEAKGNGTVDGNELRSHKQCK